MKRHLLLQGEIGCGKSTLIRQALGQSALQAGGFVTLRRTEADRLLGFDLAPAAALADSGLSGQRFLDFTREPCRTDDVFSRYGVELLKNTSGAPFAVADEFGGLELLNPGFYGALLELLKSDVPVIGVFKTPRASEALIRRLRPDSAYPEVYASLRRMLLEDPDTELLPTFGRGDTICAQRLRQWVNTYVRI